MVFESLVANLINKYLAQFIDEVSAEQLNIGTWKGNVLLNNLAIKENAFDALDLPFRVIHGHIGHIEASIPWTSIYTSPVICTLKDVYLIAVPNTQAKYDQEKESDILWDKKCKYLSKIEEAKQRAAQTAKLTDTKNKSDEDNFAAKLAAQIIKNLQITITNVHIAYEDLVTCPSKPFRIGLTLHHLVFRTKNDKQSSQSAGDSNIVHKLIEIDSLAFYCNCSDQVELLSEKKCQVRDEILHDLIATRTKIPSNLNYIVSPICLNVNTILHRKPQQDDFRLPIADVTLELDNFSIKMSRVQFEFMLLLLDSLDRMRIAGSYRKWRPNVGVKNNAKLWWRFAFNAIVNTDVRRRFDNWNWNVIKYKRNLMKQYQESYKQKLLGKEIVDDIEVIEKELDLFMIVVARGQAEVEAAKLKKTKIKSDKSETKKGWFSGWWSKGQSQQQDLSEMNIIEEIKEEMTEAERQKLYQAIGYQENDFIDLPKDFVAYKLAFLLKKISLLVEDQDHCIANFELSSTSLKINYCPASSCLNVSSVIKSMNIKGIQGVNLLENYSQNDVLSFVFDLNPLDGQYDYGVAMKMSGLKLIYDADTINKIIKMFEPPKDISLEEIQSIAANQFDQLKKKTATQIEYSIEKHKQIKVSIELEPSYVIVPRNGKLSTDISSNNELSDVLVVSLGRFTVSSNLIPKQERLKVKRLCNELSQHEILDKLKKSAYETYQLELTEIQIILSNSTQWLSDVNLMDSPRHLLCPISAKMTVQRCIITDDPHLTKLIVKAVFHEIQVKISDFQVRRILKLLTTLPFNSQETVDNQTKNVKIENANYKKIKKIPSNEMMSNALAFAVDQAKMINQHEDQNETDNIIAVSKEQNIIVYRIVKFNFLLDKVSLSLFQSTKTGATQPFVSAFLSQFDFNIDFCTNNILNADCSIGNIVMNDDRIYGSGKSRAINTLIHKKIEAEVDCKKDVMFSLLFTQTNDERLLIFTMSGFRILFSLDYINDLVEFAKKSFEIEDEFDVSKVQIDTSEQIRRLKQLKETTVKSNIINSFTFNMSTIDIILLESIENIDTKSIVLGCGSSINMKQQGNQLTFDGNINEIRIFITNYGRYLKCAQDIDASILKPFVINFVGTIDEVKQHIDLSIDEIRVIISPPIVNTILNILSKLSSTNSDSIESSREPIDVNELFVPRKNDENIWYLSRTEEANVCYEATESIVKMIDNQDEFDALKFEQQQLMLKIDKIKVIIESGGVDSMQLLMLDSSVQAKLEAYKRFSGSLTLKSDYYNENNFTWEPVIEQCEGTLSPWDFEVNVSLENENRTDIKLTSEQQLEITITKSFIGILSLLNETFENAVQHKLPEREDNTIIVKNHLGTDLVIDLVESGLIVKLPNQINQNFKSKFITLKSNEEKVFCSENADHLVLNYTLLFAGSEFKKKVNIKGHENKIYGFSAEKNCKWIVEVEVINAFSKLIVFKSTLEIVNKFNCPINFYHLSHQQEQLIGEALPSTSLHVPMNIIDSKSSLIVIKPNDEYSFSDSIDWLRIEPQKRYILECKSKTIEHKIFHIKCYRNTLSVSDEDNKSKINLNLIYFQPIVKLRNLLPYNMMYSIQGIDEVYDVPIGSDADLSLIKLGETGLFVTLCNYLNCDWICHKKLSAFGEDNEVFTWTFTAVGCVERRTTDLAVSLTIEQSSVIVSIFSPFWMFNRTSQDLVYKLDDEHQISHCGDAKEQTILLCFKPKTFFSKKKLSVSIGGSQFSDGFSIDVVGSRGNIICKSKNGRFNYYASIEIQLSRINLTKIVIIKSFYNVINSSLRNIEVSEDNDEWFKINSLTKNSFWPKQSSNPILRIRNEGSLIGSKAFSLKESTSYLVLADDIYFNVFVESNENEIVIKIDDYFDGAAPAKIINSLCGCTIKYGQINAGMVLPSNQSVLFTWKDPLKDRQFIYKINDSQEQTASLDQDYALKVEGHYNNNDVYLISFLDGKQRVLLFTFDYHKFENLIKVDEMKNPKTTFELSMKGIGLSVVDNEVLQEIIYLSISSSEVVWEFRKGKSGHFKPLNVKTIEQIEKYYQKYLLEEKARTLTTTIYQTEEGHRLDFTYPDLPRMISPQAGDLRRVASRGIWMAVKLSEHITQSHIKINQIQIDNQLLDCIFPIIMCPVHPPKSISSDQLPKNFIEVMAIIQRQTTINRFKYIQVLIQEFLIQIDFGLLTSLVEFSQQSANKNQLTMGEIIVDDCSKAIAQAQVKPFPSSSKNYYDLVHFSPLKVHLSFSLGGSEHGKQQFPFGLDFLIRSAGVTLTEFNDVLFKLEYFERKNVLLENSELISLAIDHYKNQVLKQIYLLILGLDVIGNPVGLVMGIQRGVGDFFYEPIQGIIQGPEEFVEGLSLGVKSLASHVVGGTAGALGRITGTLGEGVSALSMDEKFKKERRTRLNRKTGFAEGGKNVLFGFFKGVTGLITQPIDAIREEGAKGLVKGFSRGVVGVVAQPTVGIIDFASGSLNALKRAVDVNKEASKLRPPRLFADHAVVKPYNRYEATGNSILNQINRSGRYSSNNYIAHLQLNDDTLVIVTTKRCFFLKKAFISNNWEVDWTEEWTNIIDVKLVDSNKIKLKLKESKKKLGFFSGDLEQIIVTNSSESIQWLMSKIISVMNK